jgi:excisionase family DNA binding protein
MNRTVHYRPASDAERTTCRIRLSSFPKVSWSLDPSAVVCRTCLGIRDATFGDVRKRPDYLARRDAMSRVRVAAVVEVAGNASPAMGGAAADVASLRPYLLDLQRSIDQLTGEVRELRSSLQVAAPTVDAVTELAKGRYMNVDEAAAYLHRTVKAIRMLVHRAEIPHQKHGRRVQFDRDKLDRWMERHSRRAFGSR